MNSVCTLEEPRKRGRPKRNNVDDLEQPYTLVRQKILELIRRLNKPETNCFFWEVSANDLDIGGVVHIVGVRPVLRQTVHVLNKDGYNPVETKQEEILFKFFCINIGRVIDKERRKQVIQSFEDKGAIYINEECIDVIYNMIKNSK
jgi:hypothetical protein